jgi:hypothetical protein
MMLVPPSQPHHSTPRACACGGERQVPWRGRRLVRAPQCCGVPRAGRGPASAMPVLRYNATHQVRACCPAGAARQSRHSMRRNPMSARVFIQTMITLASASFGLVAALAWNEAIKATIQRVFGTSDSLAGLIYVCDSRHGAGGGGVDVAGTDGHPDWWRRRDYARGGRLSVRCAQHRRWCLPWS